MEPVAVAEPTVGIAFWILAAIILMSAFMVVSLRNIFHCALFLILCLFAVAGIFVLLNAEFLAAVQVLIYVGAVSILIIFAVMLTSDLASKKILQTNENALVAFFVCLVFAMGALVLVVNTSIWPYATQMLPEDNVAAIGKLMMTDFMLPFEVVSILMLAALIGAIMLAREERA
ncbi:MAG: NADH-quinone oxidoreductase subunit J [candidate division Zixibacteria bacterium]|nr:NADH-quinone oxidoreductase subunit J [candidate division Zixibacteria bacterium]